MGNIADFENQIQDGAKRIVKPNTQVFYSALFAETYDPDQFIIYVNLGAQVSQAVKKIKAGLNTYTYQVSLYGGGNIKTTVSDATIGKAPGSGAMGSLDGILTTNRKRILLNAIMLGAAGSVAAFGLLWSENDVIDWHALIGTVVMTFFGAFIGYINKEESELLNDQPPGAPGAPVAAPAGKKPMLGL